MATLTRGPITVTTTGESASGMYWHGGAAYVVGACTVTGWTPASAGGRNGAIKNLRGTLGLLGNANQCFDSRATNYNAATAASPGVTLAVGDCLIVTASGNRGARPSYFPWTTDISFIDYALPVFCVASAPETATDILDFTPNPIGNPSARVTKSATEINWNLLPDLFDRTHQRAPTFAEMETVWSECVLDLVSNWWTHEVSPLFQHPGYGETYASILSEALFRVCDDSPLDTKKGLALGLIQHGIDQYGAFLDGRDLYANGGHMIGRKAVILFAGHMLQDPDMLDVATTIGANKFYEGDGGFVQPTGGTWWGPAESFSYNYQSWSTDYLATAPSTWTLGSNQNTAEHAENYHKVVGAQLGISATMAALGLSDTWSSDGTASTIHHAITMPQSWRDAQTVAGGATGDFDYPNHQGNGSTVRGEVNASYSLDQFYRALETGFGPYSTQHAIDRASPFIWSHQAPNATSMKFEGLNAPTTGVAGTEIWVGPKLLSPITSRGWTQYANSNQAWATGLTAPNAYGWHEYTLTVPTVPDPATISGTEWCVQFVYDLGSSKVASNALCFYIPQ